MLDNYLNAYIVVDRVTGFNEYNEPIKEASTIKARLEEKIKNVRNRQGVEVVSNNTLFTLESLSTSDLVMGRPIIAINTLRDLEGDILGYEVFV
jgi:hypothetical protein